MELSERIADSERCRQLFAKQSHVRGGRYRSVFTGARCPSENSPYYCRVGRQFSAKRKCERVSFIKGTANKDADRAAYTGTKPKQGWKKLLRGTITGPRRYSRGGV